MPKPENAACPKPQPNDHFHDSDLPVIERLRAIGARAGLPYVLLARFPQGETIDFRGNRIACNWPAPLEADYARLNVFHHSSVIAALKRTILPIVLGRDGFAGEAVNDSSGSVAQRFADSGLGRTVAFSLHDAGLRQYVFAFSGGEGGLSDEAGMALVYRSMQVLDEVARSIEDDEQPSERLSRREIECLRWSAAGKSSEEIAIILQLSSHTVDSYLKSAMRKLDSVNRMQAVARAFRLRLL